MPYINIESHNFVVFGIRTFSNWKEFSKYYKNKITNFFHVFFFFFEWLLSSKKQSQFCSQFPSFQFWSIRYKHSAKNRNESRKKTPNFWKFHKKQCSQSKVCVWNKATWVEWKKKSFWHNLYFTYMVRMFELHFLQGEMDTHESAIRNKHVSMFQYMQ